MEAGNIRKKSFDGIEEIGFSSSDAQQQRNRTDSSGSSQEIAIEDVSAHR
jgi:hypothetical protein